MSYKNGHAAQCDCSNVQNLLRQWLTAAVKPENG